MSELKSTQQLHADNDISLAWDEYEKCGEVGNYAKNLLHAAEFYQKEAKTKDKENQRLTTDRQNAISLMSKSWRHVSDNHDDIITRYVTMAENQFNKKDEEIDRLTAIATKHATRCDELYGALMTIRHIANKTPDKPQDDITIDDVRSIDNAIQKIFDLSDESLGKSRTEADK